MSQIIAIRQQAKVIPLVPIHSAAKVEKTDRAELFSLFRSHVQNLKEVVQLVEKTAFNEMVKNPHLFCVAYAKAERMGSEINMMEHHLESVCRYFKENQFSDILEKLYDDMSPVLESDFN